MSSTYTSVHFIPGKRAGTINQVINTSNKTNFCACVGEINSKIKTSSNSTNDQTLTQNQRAVNAIKYSLGGRIQYGNSNIVYTGIDFLGKNQPVAPFRNKF